MNLKSLLITIAVFVIFSLNGYSSLDKSTGGDPVLEYSSNLTDDDNNGSSEGDNDGRPEGGEEIEMRIQLFNSGDWNALNVSASISTADPDITITDNNKDYPDLIPSGFGWSIFDYNFDIAPGILVERVVMFHIVMTCDGGVWEDDFPVTIYPDDVIPLPTLAYNDHNYAPAGDDNDGLPEGGETIEMPVEIINTGLALATNVSAVLSTLDPDITITDANESYPDVPMGAERWCNLDYNFDIAPGIIAERVVMFHIIITSDEGVWESDFPVTIYPDNSFGAVELSYFDHNYAPAGDDDDDLPEGGETIEMPVSIENIGSLNATNISAVISTLDADITITDANENYPDILAGGNAFCNLDYNFDIASGILVERDVEFILDITSDEGNWTDTFIVRIYPDNTIPQPFLLYNTHSWDTAGDDDDGLAEGGESIGMPVEIYNSGPAMAHNVSAVLSTVDPDITITDMNESYPDIVTDGHHWSNYEYNFDIAPGIVAMRHVEFTLHITSDEGTWTDTFTIEIYPDNESLMPILAYNNHNFAPAGADNDGLAEGGESIDMPISIFNSGNLMATGTSATLSTLDPDITITDFSENYGEVNMGSEEWCDFDYDFDIAPGILVMRHVEFTLEITSNEGTWTDTFTIEIYPDNITPEPFLLYNTHSWDTAGADDDGLAEGGESIGMPVEIFNSGPAMAHNVSAVLSTVDPDITITDMNESYPDIATDGHEWSNFEYNFDIAPGILAMRHVEFTLDITSDEGTWTDTFTIEIYPDNVPLMPILAYNDHNFAPAGADNDGLAEGGESIDMPVSIFNSGNVMATGTSATLSTLDPDITITDFSENYGEVNMGSEEWCDFDYNFDIAPGILVMRHVEFTLEITSNEGIWTDTFTIEIYPDNITPEPFLLYNTHSWDTAGADDDGLAEGGESIGMPVEIFNSGPAMAHNISAVLSTVDPDITITDMNESYPDIATDGHEWSNFEYNFDIAPGILAMRHVEFTLDITSDEGTWTDTFTIEIYPDNVPLMPILAYNDHNFAPAGADDDGLAEGGESIDMPVSIFNSGNVMATGTSATLSTLDPDITITDFSENFGEVNMGSEKWCTFDYNFDIAPGILAMRHVEFILEITSNEGTWTDTFTIEIYPDNITPEPFLLYNTHSWDTAGADDDGLVEGGESVGMPVEIYNSGPAMAHNVSAVLSTLDPDITITDMNESYPDIATDGHEWSNYTFDFDVAPGILAMRHAEFTLVMTSDEGTWTDTFTIEIYPDNEPLMPLLFYNSHSFAPAGADNDGLAEGGESINMPVSIFNDGNVMATGTSAILTTLDPDITITDNSEHFGQIAIASDKWSGYDYNFDIAPGILAERDVEFTLEITSNEGTWTSTFLVHIYPDNIYPEPFLLYNTHSWDTAGADDDGLAEGGESVGMPVEIFNSGNGHAYNVSAILSTVDPDITITDMNENYPDIESDGHEWSNYTFNFDIAPGIIAPRLVEFTLDITSDEGTWTDTFTVEIYPDNVYPEPLLIYNSHSWDTAGDDDDGLAEGGEYIGMPVDIYNSGMAAATNVSAVLSTVDPDITITDMNESYPDIDFDDHEWSNYTFNFEIAPGILAMRHVEFTLDMTSDEGTWTDTFTIEIYPDNAPLMPELMYNSHSFAPAGSDDDGLAEGGESINMPVSIFNNGNVMATATSAILSTIDPDITITDNSEYFGDIDMATDKWSGFDYDFDIAPGIIAERDVEFTLEITSAEGTWTSTFLVHIYPDNVYPEPFLLYNTHSWDTAGDDDDGLAEGGESVGMPVEIFNSGNAMATNVTAVLSTVDPDITITDMNESYPDIDSDGQEWSNYTFDFDIAPGILAPRNVEFTLDITSDEGTWTDTFIIEIYPDNIYPEPFLLYNTHSWDTAGDDDDGLAEGGESIGMPVEIFNSGNAMATNVSAVLSTVDPDITITDMNESYPDIDSDGHEFSNYEFNFDIAPGIAAIRTVEFILDITADEGTWTDTFTIEIYPDNEPLMPVLMYNDHNFAPAGADDDGLAEGGESINMPLSLFNDGNVMATGISAILSTIDPDITITDNTEYFDEIMMGTEGWSIYDYNFDIAPGILAERDVEFTLDITSNEGTWTSTFLVHIYPDNVYPEPFLLYNTHSWDTAGDDDDGLAEGGESIGMPVEIFNSGNETATNVSAVLSTSNPLITIIDANENYPDILSDGHEWSNSDFDFDIAPGILIQQEVYFTLEMTSDQGFWTSTFSIQIYPDNVYPEPFLLYNTHAFSPAGDDDDGIAEGGESIGMPVEIFNSGNETATNISAILSCPSPLITIIDANESYPDILSDGHEWSINDFDFDIATGIVTEQDVEFTLDMTSDQGSWTSTFMVTIYPDNDPLMPNLMYNDHNYAPAGDDDDGLAEGGESINMPLSIYNSGNVIANNVSAIISTTDADIMIIDDSESFGDIDFDSEGWSNFDYDFDIASGITAEREVEFTIEMTSDEGVWTDTFTITIYPDNVYPQPFLLYNTHSWDTAGDDDDGLVEGGETVGMPVEIFNSGVATATNVSAILSCSSPLITIIDANENYPDIVSDGHEWSNSDFDFMVATGITSEQNIEFTLQITSDEGVWTDNFLIEIYPDNDIPSPLLAYNTHSWNPAGEDYDGLAEGGETIGMPVSLFNSGNETATNVSAILSTTNPLITIIDANENYPDIIAGTQEWCASDFDFEIASGVTSEQDVEFKLHITCDQGTWLDIFTIEIYPDNDILAPILEYNNHDFDPAGDDDDGLAEGGESVKMPLSLYNSGNTDANNVSVVLSCADADITVTDFAENFGDIEMDSEGWSNFTFDFDVATGITHERDVEFTLHITSDEGTWTDTFFVEIYPDNPIDMPNIVYSSHEIDDTDSSVSDGDGIPESGESVQLPVTLYNNGTGDAEHVSAILSCEDPDITLIDVSEYFGYIPAGEEEESGYSYDFVISDDCPAKEVEFTLHITSDEGTWISHFQIQISLPDGKDMVYPNPSNGTFKILSNNLGGNYNYQLIDISGNEVFTGEVFVADNQEPVMNFKGLVTGIYFLKLQNGIETKMQKIIIQ